MLATDRLQSNTKPGNTKVANTPTRFILLTRFVLFLSPIILSSPNSNYSKLRSAFFSLINEERLKLMKESRCFYCQ